MEWVPRVSDQEERRIILDRIDYFASGALPGILGSICSLEQLRMFDRNVGMVVANA